VGASPAVTTTSTGTGLKLWHLVLAISVVLAVTAGTRYRPHDTIQFRATWSPSILPAEVDYGFGTNIQPVGHPHSGLRSPAYEYTEGDPASITVTVLDKEIKGRLIIAEDATCQILVNGKNRIAASSAEHQLNVDGNGNPGVTITCSVPLQ
jgi:hypothetical protein